MNTFVECFRTILTGEKEDSRKAARQVRKLLHSSSNDRSNYDDIRILINNARVEYAKIIEDWRQENFVMAVSVLYFLHDRESEPDLLFPWLFDLLQHDNGYIRHAAVRMFENDLGPLTYHIRYPDKENFFNKLKTDRADEILFQLYSNLQELINDLSKPSYNRYKLVASLPTGSFKSVQMVMGSLTNDLGDKYIKDFDNKFRSMFLNGIELAGVCDCEICKKINQR